MSSQYITYTRLSKQKVEGNQYGFDSQEFDIQHLLITEGGEVIGEFSEFFTGKSIWTQRKELVKAVEMCEKTGATLLVSKVDRLGRQVESVAHLLNRIPVKIATLPSASNMIIQIMSVMAEEEARAISERTKAALSSAKERGVKVGGASTRRRVAYNTQYESTKNKYQQYQKPLENMRGKGYTYEKIAEQFNLMGLATSKGCNHTKASVNRIANYLGLI